MGRRVSTCGVLVFLGLVSLAWVGHVSVVPPWDGSRTTPVHRIPVLDEYGIQIVPDAPDPPPFSARTTCGPCHPYEVIEQGWHFNSMRKDVPPGCIGEPWVWMDPATGTQLPLSYRDWAGVWSPEAVGMTPWRFTQVFGRHMPGGDMGEPETDTPDSRWQVSGHVEINCLGCHSGSPGQDQSEWAKQMERENFRWAATAATGLGEVGGMASRVHESWALFDGPNPDDTQWAVRPFVTYDFERFDSRYNVLFDVRHEPPDERCLYCHSSYTLDEPRWMTQRDVHTDAGIQCAACHRNNLFHRMIRGHPGEAEAAENPRLGEFTCEGCHMGMGDKVGRLGAPRPDHRGLPPLHFEKMTCTSCHSGSAMKAGEPRRIRLSRIHRLGIHGRARWFTELPEIIEPIFARNAEGKLAPHRLLWPAFWAHLEGDRVTPLKPDEVAGRVQGVFEAERQVGFVLSALATIPEITGEPVLFHGGKMYRRDIDGELEAETYNGTLDEWGWGWDFGDGVRSPLSPPPKPDEGGYLESETETAILQVLGALRLSGLNPGEPVLAFGGAVYHVSPEGWVESEERHDLPEEGPLWGWSYPDRIDPLVPDHVLRAVADTDGRIETLNEEQIVLGLQGLPGEDEEPASYAYVGAGKMFRLGTDGALEVTDHPAAAPVLWPIAHEVWPREQSLGAQGCLECHAEDSPYYTGQVPGLSPLLTAKNAILDRGTLSGLSAGALRWGAWRERVVKGCSFPIVAGFILLLLLHFSLLGAHRSHRQFADKEIIRHGVIARLGHYLLFLSVLLVLFTGFTFLLGAWNPLGGGSEKLARKIHELFGYGMAAGLIVVGLVWVRDMLWASYDRQWLAVLGGYLGGRTTPPAGRFNAGQKLFFWWALLLGMILAVTGLAMASSFKWSAGQQAQIYTLHDAAALLMILSVLLHVYLSVFVDPESMRGIFGGRVLASWAKERHDRWETETAGNPNAQETATGDGKQTEDSKG